MPDTENMTTTPLAQALAFSNGHLPVTITRESDSSPFAGFVLSLGETSALISVEQMQALMRGLLSDPELRNVAAFTHGRA